MGLVLATSIVAPVPGSVVYDGQVELVGTGAPGSAATEVCWELYGAVVDQTIGSCFGAGDAGWRSQKVLLPSRGNYSAVLRSRSSEGRIESESRTWFSYWAEPRCRALLEARSGAHRERYREVSNFDASAADEYTNLKYAPPCYEFWESISVPDYLSTVSASRGFFGVDFSAQEMGHGDRVVLDFVLSRHRHVATIAEFGTFGGVTSLYLGVAAALRGGHLDTFDVVDVRHAGVKTAWLPTMRFHLGDANTLAPHVDLVLRQADLVLVDHVDRLNFVRTAVAPRLKPNAVLLVHDFTPFLGPEATLHADWDAALAPFGIARAYADLQAAFTSSLAVFLPHQAPTS